MPPNLAMSIWVVALLEATASVARAASRCASGEKPNLSRPPLIQVISGEMPAAFAIAI